MSSDAGTQFLIKLWEASPGNLSHPSSTVRSMQSEPVPVTTAEVHLAANLRDACAVAIERHGGRIVYDDTRLPSDAIGYLEPFTRDIIIRPGLGALVDAVTVAHETGHFFDYGLDETLSTYSTQREINECEAIAYYVSEMASRWFRVHDFCDPAWFPEQVNKYLPYQELINNDKLIDRADRALRRILPSDGQQWLTDHRRSEERYDSGLTNTEFAKMVWNALRRKRR